MDNIYIISSEQNSYSILKATIYAFSQGTYASRLIGYVSEIKNYYTLDTFIKARKNI